MHRCQDRVKLASTAQHNAAAMHVFLQHSHLHYLQLALREVLTEILWARLGVRQSALRVGSVLEQRSPSK